MFTKTLLPDTLRAIKLVAQIEELKNAYLAGGTALALQIGHRISVDLDFFTQEKFNEDTLSSKLIASTKFVQEGATEGTVWGRIGETRFSMFHYQYPLLEPTAFFENIQIASPTDIAAMKIHAIEGRGIKRDFIDIYFLAKMYTLEDMLGFYQKKYSVEKNHLYAVLRSLDYFEDAEQESEMPKMLIEVDWERVKEYFRNGTRVLVEKNLQA